MLELNSHGVPVLLYDSNHIREKQSSPAVYSSFSAGNLEAGVQIEVAEI